MLKLDPFAGPRILWRHPQRMTRKTPLLLGFALVLSGATALGLQMVWARMLAVHLGQEWPAVLAVTTGIFAGMAVGGWVSGKWLAWGLRPLTGYIACELLVALTAAASGWLIPSAGYVVDLLAFGSNLASVRLLAALIGTTLFLAPATVAMGATLPLVERFLAGSQRPFGGYYAANLFGAVAGVILGIGWLQPEFGLRNSSFILAAFGLGAALLAYTIGRTGGQLGGAGWKPALPSALSSRATLVPAFALGLAGLSFQTVATRLLALSSTSTIYAVAETLAVWLLASFLGAALWQVLGPKLPGRATIAMLSALAALAMLVGIAAGIHLPEATAPPTTLGDLLGRETMRALIVTGPAALLLGAAFVALIHRTRDFGGNTATAIAVNALGGALGPAFGGWLLVPAVGIGAAASAIAAALVVGALPRTRGAIAVGLAVIGCALGLPFVRSKSGGTAANVVTEKDGFFGNVRVVEFNDGSRALRVNERMQMGGTAPSAAAAARRHTLLPLLLAPKTESMLFLGVGTGVSLGPATQIPGLQSDGVELVPEVAGLLGSFEPQNGGVRNHPRVRIHVADARRFVRSSERRWDVIVGDLFHPYLDGAAFLYTREHFAAIRDRLAPGGLVCQWLPAYQLDDASFRSITRSFLDVFPSAEAWLLRMEVDSPVVGLIARAPGPQSDTDWPSRLGQPGWKEALSSTALTHPALVRGLHLANAATLRTFVGDAPANTDDRPAVLFSSVNALTMKATLAGDHVLRLAIAGGSTFPINDHGGSPEDLTAFKKARNTFLRGLQKELAGETRAAIDDWIASAGMSPLFTFGYAKAATIASAVGSADPVFAKDILGRLRQARPDLKLADQLLERINAGAK